MKRWLFGALLAIALASPAWATTQNEYVPGSCAGCVYIGTFPLTSSAILASAATTVATASGSIQVDQIILETSATGLAACTNVSFTTTNTKGLLTLFAEAAANLGANKNVQATAASVTAMRPFVIEDTKLLKVQATVADCTGAGVLTLVIIGKRITAGATLN